jgi:hypothetical protein
MRRLGDHQQSQQEHIDSRIIELFQHIRFVLDLVEDIVINPKTFAPQPEGAEQQFKARSNTKKYMGMREWTAVSGMSRAATYKAFAEGYIHAHKIGRRTVVDVDQGLAWIASQPAPKVKRRKTVSQ